MSENRDIVLTTINETKEEIESFKKALIAKGKQLPDIKAIAKSLAGIEKVISDIKKLCNDETEILQKIFENLTYTQKKELLKKTDVMFDVISENLPYGMELKNTENEDYKQSKNIRVIWFDDKKIGEIKILSEEEGALNIEVSVNENIDKFEVIKPNRMYHIVSFINTKFNYE
jgi:hypothetical protein